jgi:hypothetical protein
MKGGKIRETVGDKTREIRSSLVSKGSKGLATITVSSTLEEEGEGEIQGERQIQIDPSEKIEGASI